MLNVGTNIKVQATVVIQRAKHNRKYLSTFGEDNVLPLPSHFSALLGMNYDKDTKYISWSPTELYLEACSKQQPFNKIFKIPTW